MAGRRFLHDAVGETRLIKALWLAWVVGAISVAGPTAVGLSARDRLEGAESLESTGEPGSPWPTGRPS